MPDATTPLPADRETVVVALKSRSAPVPEVLEESLATQRWLTGKARTLLHGSRPTKEAFRHAAFHRSRPQSSPTTGSDGEGECQAADAEHDQPHHRGAPDGLAVVVAEVDLGQAHQQQERGDDRTGLVQRLADQ